MCLAISFSLRGITAELCQGLGVLDAVYKLSNTLSLAGSKGAQRALNANS